VNRRVEEAISIFIDEFVIGKAKFVAGLFGRFRVGWKV